jgi:CheY-like chemotaxis protein
MNQPKHALIVDDNQLNSRLVAVFLKRLGWQTTIAGSGDEALAVLRERPMDMTLLDLRMPKVSGEQVCTAIRQDLGLTTMPVIAYTAHSMPEEKERILAAGFNGLLIKPISFDDVRQACAAFEGEGA